VRGTRVAPFARVHALGFLWLSLGLPIWLAGAPPGTPTALASHEGRVLLGTERGLYAWEGTGWSLALTRGGVRDLAVGPRGAIIATARGLYAWEPGQAAPLPEALGAGARVRAVAVAADGTEWVGTEVGLFERAPGAAEFRRDVTLPSSDVTGVRTAGDALFVATRAALWMRRGGASFEPVVRGQTEGWWELCGAERIGERTLLCVPEGLWVLSDRAAPARQRLNVGALRRLAAGPRGLFVASERGLFELAGDPPELRTKPAGVDTETYALAAGADEILVATATGVARVPFGGAVPRELPLRAKHGRSPDVGAVQRAALDYLELSPAWIGSVETRARRAPLWPELIAGFGSDRARARSRGRDQSFTSGDLRDLVDASYDTDAAFDVRVELVWDLQELASPERAILVSRERRELIELRDQVLERVNRLYFERLRALERLAALPEDAGAERVELELRARELAAGLDAWTGGAFSRLLERSPQIQGSTR
jgi:hypothetical protein